MKCSPSHLAFVVYWHRFADISRHRHQGWAVVININPIFSSSHYNTGIDLETDAFIAYPLDLIADPIDCLHSASPCWWLAGGLPDRRTDGRTSGWIN